MLGYLLTRGLAQLPQARRDRGSGRSAYCRPRFRFFRPLVEILESRTLLSFITAPTYAAGGVAVSVAVGDLNGDGFPDLAVVSGYGTGMVNILLGKGDGTFQ